jgi:bloom syndrome protein
MLDYIVFLSCLEFAVLNSLYQDTIFKPKQVICLENIYLKKDVMCVLPTGYGKSLIFHLLPMLLYAKRRFADWRSKSIFTDVVHSIVVVVSPLNSLMSDQISRLSMGGIRASIINVKAPKTDQDADAFDENTEDVLDVDFSRCEEKMLRDGHYHIVFAHPETLISTKYGRELLLSETYQQHVVAIVVDEAHCIVDWLVI